jgi:CRP/FNR family transcriptional regulator, cyclic AMP receptor protein
MARVPCRSNDLCTRQSGRSSGVEHDLAKVGVEGSNPFARSSGFRISEPLALSRSLSHQVAGCVGGGILAANQQERETIIAVAFGCSADIARAVDAAAQTRHHAARSEIVAMDGDAGHPCLMFTGEAQAVAYAASGNVVRLSTYGPGALFGEAAALGEIMSEEEEVIALHPSDVGHFSNAGFIRLIENYGAVAIAVSRGLMQRLGEATRRIVAVSTLSTTGRIHAELLRRAKAGGAMTISPPPVLSQLAAELGSTRETVSRTINALEKRGIISRDAAGLRVIAPHRLEDLIY